MVGFSKFLVLAVPVVGQDLRGLGNVIQSLATMRDSVQDLHNVDAEAYEKVACHCDTETKQLVEPATGSIPTNVGLVNTNAAIVEDRTAFKEQSETDLEQNRAELSDLIKVEKSQKKAWSGRKSQLTADISEATQAANALGSAMDFLGEHKEIVQLVQGMQDDVKSTLKEFNKDLGEGTAERNKQNGIYAQNKDNEEGQITQGTIDIADAKAKIGSASTSMLESEASLKDLSLQLKDLTAYCEDQAKDWDEMSGKRQTDFRVLSIAMNVLTCGKEECGSAPATTFLQTFSKVTKVSMKTNMATKRNAIRSLVRFGEKTGNQDLLRFRQYLGKDPLMGAKKLLRKLIEKLTLEAAADQGEQNECVTTLTECKTKRDLNLEEVTKAKIALEELGQSVEEDKKEFAEKSGEWKFNWDDSSEITHVDIPDLVNLYEKNKAQMTQEKNWLSEAIVVLRKHFGVEDNNLADKPSESTSGLSGSPERKTSGTSSQSTGASVVRMLQQNLDEKKAFLKTYREEHITSVAGLRKQVQDLSSTAAAAKARYEFLDGSIKKETASFNEKVVELQGRLDSAASNGRCVQELEPCGVQTDTRAKREAEMRALKDAWTKLAEGTQEDNPWGEVN